MTSTRIDETAWWQTWGHLLDWPASRVQIFKRQRPRSPYAAREVRRWRGVWRRVDV